MPCLKPPAKATLKKGPDNLGIRRHAVRSLLSFLASIVYLISLFGV